MDITEKLEHGLREFEKTPYDHKEGEDELELHAQRRNWFYIHICNIYDFTMPNVMMCNGTTFRILRNTFTKLMLDSDDRISSARRGRRGWRRALTKP